MKNSIMTNACAKSIQKESLLSRFILKQYSFEFSPSESSDPAMQKIIQPVIKIVDYNAHFYADRLFSEAGINFSPGLETMATKRKVRFLAGRIAARDAIQSLEKKPVNQRCQIEIGAKREPVWPEKYQGSISHTDGFSISAVIPVKAPFESGIGVDVQSFLNTSEIENAQRVVLTDQDKKLFKPGIRANHGEAVSHNALFTLIFSSKESFFKAAFPIVKYYFDFHVVSVKDIDMQNQTLTLRCEVNLNSKILKGNEYRVLFKFKNGIKEPKNRSHATVFTYCEKI